MTRTPHTAALDDSPFLAFLDHLAELQAPGTITDEDSSPRAALTASDRAGWTVPRDDLVAALHARFAEQETLSAADLAETVQAILAAEASGGGDITSTDVHVDGPLEAAKAKRKKKKAPAGGDQEGTQEHGEGCTCPDCVSGGDGDTHAAPADTGRAYGESSPLRSQAGEPFRLYVAVPRGFSEGDDWIPFLPRPGEFKHQAYGPISITRTRNEAFCSNFNAGIYQSKIPLDAEHQTKLSGAMGWVHELRMNEDGSADARVEWTDRGRTMLANKRYGFVSPEWYDEWPDPATGQRHSDIIIGGALTTRPYFKEGSLRPLVASERGIYLVPDDDSTPEPQAAGEERTPMPDESKTPATDPVKDQPLAMSEDAAKRFAELESQLATERTRSTQATERIALLETTARRREFAEQAKDWYGETAGHVSFMEKLSDEDRTFYATQQAAIAEQMRSSHLFKEAGVRGEEGGSSSALGKLEGLAKSIRASEAGLSQEKAFARAMSENPDLYAEYLHEKL
jgi:hypothetical protein